MIISQTDFEHTPKDGTLWGMPPHELKFKRGMTSSVGQEFQSKRTVIQMTTNTGQGKQ
jgi:hypothetical protein